MVVFKMKNLFNLVFVAFSFLAVFSCKVDDSLAISQDQLLRGNKWQLKEIRNINGNLTETDKLLDCERQSTLDFTDLTKYAAVDYNTDKGSCNQTQSNGTYTYVTGSTRRLRLIETSGENIDYYMYQLDPYYMILQDTISDNDTILKLRLQVYEPIK